MEDVLAGGLGWAEPVVPEQEPIEAGRARHLQRGVERLVGPLRVREALRRLNVREVGQQDIFPEHRVVSIDQDAVAARIFLRLVVGRNVLGALAGASADRQRRNPPLQ